jgi:hypothetical protein
MSKRKNRTGSIRQLKSGSFELAIRLGTKANGKHKRKYKYVYVNSHSDAEAELLKFIKENIGTGESDKANFFINKSVKLIEESLN